MRFSIPLLALCSAAYALSLPQNAKVIDAVTYMAGNETDVAKIHKRTPGAVLITAANNFCVDLRPDLDNLVSSFGPDPGARCQLFNAHGCALNGEGIPQFSGPIAFPGVNDFSISWLDANGAVNAPFNDIISSYRCTFT
ncbi:hypothetical protein C8J57DRAFT_1233631 [Mycena rebaudengoi]|nr:hypothetical protein C8J57DRAFT_1235244 [Mycena rebaudengoi]KAJ7259264.1 hypothetical protein C8J57DRAFT_1233631 [Mycena rebaudengoi]